MSLGEKATLLISGDYAYGDRGFPGLIPANATLILYVFTAAIASSSTRPLANLSKQ
jgi:FK506-binding protein 1